jgi:hypothetical protein
MSSDVRGVLRSAIEAHKDAAEATAGALKNLDGAKSFVRSLEARVQSFADLDARISKERAVAIKAALAAGERPSMDLSPELAASNAEKVEAENQLSAARQAAASLAADHAQEQVKEVGSRQVVQHAAADVFAAEIGAMIERLKEIRAEEIRLVAMIMASDITWLNGGNIWTGRAQIIREGLNIVHEPAARDLVQTVNTPAAKAFRSAQSALSAFAKQLATDADAVLEMERC